MTKPDVTPGVSVVTPVKGRVGPTRRLAESLAAAIAACPEPAEALLIDDSGQAESRAHQETCDRYGIRYVRTDEPHVGAKRNLGVQLARHDLVLFTDSDCRVPPDLLRRQAAALRAAPARVAGLAGPTYSEPSTTLVARIMRHSATLNWDFERPAEGGELVWATTTNLIVRRSAIEEAGGFPSNSLTNVGGEDVELGIRLTDRGYVIATAPDAVVLHDSLGNDSVRAVCRRLYMYGQSEQWLSSIHPERVRPRLNVATALGIAAVASAALAPCTRGRSLLLAPVLAGAAAARNAVRIRRMGQPPPGVPDALARTAMEWCFDVGAVVAAVRLRRPRLLFTGFKAEG
jgi:hypothetical protein